MAAVRASVLLAAAALLNLKDTGSRPADAFQCHPAASRGKIPSAPVRLHSTKEDGAGASLRGAIANLASILDEPGAAPREEQSSIVHIIGTGLCPTLLNLPLSTLLILSEADVVLYDSLGLSHEDIRRVVPPHCDVICVGKRGDRKSWKQGDIDELLLQMATDPMDSNNQQQSSEQTMKSKKTIVRLKGGDPFLFGRTKTEIEALRSHNVPYTYTPGISSCIAGPHLGGIPLTDPSLDCQSFAVWSGTDAFGMSWGLNDDDDTEGGKKWQGLGVDVLVFLMIGRLDKLEALCRSIAGTGDIGDDERRKWRKDTPCAVIQNAGGLTETVDDSTLPVQRVWRSTLGNIVDVIQEEDATRTSVSPAVFVVGATAALDLLSQDYTQRLE
ncbi:hypothetical protein ACHAXT_002140 [Thalassiosira profunda]